MGLLQNITDIVKIPLEVGQTLISANQAKQAQLRQNRINVQMANDEFNRNLQMWKMQNEYNSPKSQMQRFQDAGLNPNLMYGQGSSGNSTVIPKYQAPEQRSSAFTPDFTNVISNFQDSRIKNAQIDGLEADAKVKRVNAEFARLMTEAKLFSMRKSGEISEANYQRISSELASTWGHTFNVTWGEEAYHDYYGIPNFTIYGKTNKLKNEEFSKNWRAGVQSKLEQAQQQIELGNLLKRIRTKEAEFGESGGKFFNPILQLLKLMGGSLQ